MIMPIDALITLLVLLIVLVSMIKSNQSPDLVLWIGLAALLVFPVPGEQAWQLGVLTPAQGLAGLANEGVVTLAVLFVVVAGLQETGALHWVSRWFLGNPANLSAAQHRIIWPTAIFSGFINNTPLVAMTMPLVDDWARQHNLSASKLLMPLSFASILGGACTLIGTSTNIIVNGWLISELNHPGLGMFEIAKAGVPIAVAGLFFMLITQRYLLKERKPAISPTDDPRNYTVEMIVAGDGGVAGKTISEAGLRGLSGVYLVEIERNDDILPAVSANVVLQDKDRLVFAGVVDSIVDLLKIRGLLPATDQVFKMSDPRHKRIMLEAVVSDSCPLVGGSIRAGRFRTVYNAAVIAVARNGERINKKIGDIILKAGDTLLLETRPAFIEQQRNRRDFYLVSQLQDARPVKHERAALAIGLLVLMIASVTSGILSMMQAAMLAAAGMIISNCCSMTVARKAIDLQTILVIAAAIGLGKAMEVSGLAELLGIVMRNLAGANASLMLAAIFGLTMLLGNIVTAKAGAVLMLPIALVAAQELGVSSMPFIIAVMLASATSLATPISYPTNLMIYGSGGYRFGDYLLFGAPLSLLIWGMAVALIPVFWQF